MEIDVNFNSSSIGACIRIDMWNEYQLNDNPLAWDILYKMDQLLEDNKFFKENNIKGPRMYYIKHEIYNSCPNVLEYLESAFSQAYDIVMSRLIPVQKDIIILKQKKRIKELEKVINVIGNICD